GDNKGFIAQNGMEAVGIPVDQRSAPLNFSGVTDTGETVTSDDYRGQVLVVNFWYAACAPCVVEAPELEAAYAEVGGADVAFLGLNTSDEAPTARSFAKDNGISYPSLISVGDRELKLAFADATPLNATPVTLVIDREGRVAEPRQAAGWRGAVHCRLHRRVLGDHHPRWCARPVLRPLWRSHHPDPRRRDHLPRPCFHRPVRLCAAHGQAAGPGQHRPHRGTASGTGARSRVGSLYRPHPRSDHLVVVESRRPRACGHPRPHLLARTRHPVRPARARPRLGDQRRHLPAAPHSRHQHRRRHPSGAAGGPYAHRRLDDAHDFAPGGARQCPPPALTTSQSIRSDQLTTPIRQQTARMPVGRLRTMP
ncbi:MAG: TlpA family protein disulfide reductase, partial [Micrococcales bacterium]|nr:TlpA family protein disulfide reductase [Micrococcales bacterium]